MRYVKGRWFVVIASAAALTLGMAGPGFAAEEAAGDWSVEAALNQAPAEAPMLVLVPNMARLSEKIAALNDALNLGTPELAGALAEIKRQIGVTEGVKDDGPAMAAFLLLAEPGDAKAVTQADAPMRIESLMFVPTSDAAAVRTGLQAEQPEGVSAIATRDGHAGYVAQAGNFTVLAERAELLEGYEAGNAAAAFMEELGAVGRAALNRSDLVLILRGEDKERFVEVAQRRSTERMMAEMAAAQEAAQQNDPGAAPDMGQMMAQQMMIGQMNAANAAVERYKPWLRDSKAILIGLDLTEAGIGMTVTAQMKDGTELADALGKGGGARDLMAKMPNQPYVLAAAVATEGLDLEALGYMSGMENSIQNIALTAGEGAGVKGMTYAMYVAKEEPAGGMMASPFNTVTFISTEKPAELVEAIRTRMDELNAQVEAQPAAVNTGGQLVAAQYMANKVQVEGKRVDQYVLRYAPQQQMMGGMEMMMGMMGGMGGGDKGGFIVADDGVVVITESNDLTQLKETLTALKAKPGLASDGGAAKVRQNLLDDPAMEGFLDLGPALRGPLGPLLMMAGIGPIDPGEELAPVGFSAEVREQGLAMRTYIPHSLTRLVVSVAQSMQPQDAPPAGPMPGDRPANRRGPQPPPNRGR